MRFLGHVIRKEKLEHLSITGLIPGKEHELDNDKHIYKVTTVTKITHVAINVWTMIQDDFNGVEIIQS